MHANDGAVDCRGRIFQGLMFDDRVSDPTEDGVLLRLDPDGSLHRVVEHDITPNGLGWNRANTVMFWAESRSGNVYAFDTTPTPAIFETSASSSISMAPITLTFRMDW